MSLENQPDLNETRFERIIEKAYKKTIGMPVFYQELLNAKLYYLTKHIETPNYDEHGNIKVSLSVLQGTNEESILPIFSSIQKVIKMNWTNVDICSQTGENIFKKFQNMHIILNPKSEYEKIFSPDEIKDLLDGKLLSKLSELHLEAGNQFKFIQPKKFPKEFSKILSQIMKNNPEIKKAYLAYVLDDNSKTGFRVIIAIDAICDIRNITPYLFNFLNTYNLLSEDINMIDFISYNDLSGSVLTYFQSLKPFYDKELSIG